MFFFFFNDNKKRCWRRYFFIIATERILILSMRLKVGKHGETPWVQIPLPILDVEIQRAIWVPTEMLIRGISALSGNEKVDWGGNPPLWLVGHQGTCILLIFKCCKYDTSFNSRELRSCYWHSSNFNIDSKIFYVHFWVFVNIVIIFA